MTYDDIKRVERWLNPTWGEQLKRMNNSFPKYCGLDNCFARGGNCWSPRQIVYFYESDGNKYILYINEDVLADGLTEIYLEEEWEDTDFEHYDEWLNTDYGHEMMEHELLYWLNLCLEFPDTNSDSQFVKTF